MEFSLKSTIPFGGVICKMYICTEWFAIVLIIIFKGNKAMTNIDAVFRVCGGCANKINDASLLEGVFRCSLVAHIINTDIVRYDTDATDCIREGRYRNLGYNNANVEFYKD